MQKTKAAKWLASLIVALVLTLFTFAPASVTALGDAYPIAVNSNYWSKDWDWTGNAKFSIDTNEKYFGDYSIKIENTDFNDAYFSKSFVVEPNCYYKISAMVKYENFAANPQESAQTGANVGISNTHASSDFCTSDKWTKLEYEVFSGDKTEISFCLRNGMYGGTCMGTAYFSDVKIEKAQATASTSWNILCLVFKNVNATANINNQNVQYKSNLDDVDVLYLTGVVNHLKKSFAQISGGLMSVKNVDVYAVEEPITELNLDNNSVNLDNLNHIYDKYLEKSTYHQIITISPVSDIAIGWAGLGGTFYRDSGIIQIGYKSGSDYPGDYFPKFPDAIFVHEILHCIETASRAYKNIAELHDGEKYGYSGTNEWIEWYSDYMQNKLPDGKGLPNEVYTVYYKGKYTLITNGSDMSVELSLKGHVLGNEKIGIGDAQFAFRAALKLVDLTDDQLYAADIDGNGRVDMSDAMRIFRYALGLSNEL